MHFKTDTLKCILFSCPQFTIQFSLSVTFHRWMFGLPSVWAIQCQVVCEKDSQDTIFLYICFSYPNSCLRHNCTFLFIQRMLQYRWQWHCEEEKISQLCWIRHKERVMLGDQLSRRSRNDPSPHFRSPICGAGCLSISETKSWHCCSRAGIEGTRQGGVNGEKYTRLPCTEK